MCTIPEVSAPLATIEVGTGPAVLLVHGWGGFKEGWGRLPQALAGAGFRAVAVDLPGWGESPAPRRFPHTPEAYAEALAPVAGRLAPAAVVAHSMGAFPVLALSALAPALLSRIALVAPAPLAVVGRARRLAATPVIGGWLAAAGVARSRRDRAGVMQAFAEAAAHPERLRADPEIVTTVKAAADRFIAAPALVLGRSAHRALRENAVRLARCARHPALVVVGEADRVGRPQEAAEVAGALPDGRLTVLPDCGHFPFLECLDGLMAALVPHLRGAG
jgi:pimeloyl-ACP methyl ester carboxylesterase